QVPPSLGLVGGHIEDQTREQSGGLVVPEGRLPLAAGDDEEVGEGRGIGIAEVRLSIEECQRVKGGGLLAAKPEGIDDDDPAELAAPCGGDGVILALEIDDDQRSRVIEEIGDDRPYALAGPGRGNGQDVPFAVIAEKLPAVPAEDQTLAAQEGAGVPPSG